MKCSGFLLIIFLFNTNAAEERQHIFLQRNENRIVGGEFIDIRNVPCQVSLKYENRHICGGSILNERFILTAAHCTYGLDIEFMTVYMGSNSTSVNGTSFNLTKVTNHPLYRNFDYDFAILELSGNISFNDRQKPIELPTPCDDVENGTLLQTSGWGKTKNSSESNEFLRGVTVPKIDQELCSQAYSNRITDRMICAGFIEGGKDACTGDSCGPLLQGNVLVGVVSWGKDCALPGYPGVYARVSSVRQWIEAIVGF